MTIAELKGQIVLVTGGANGIGAAIVRAFHAQGAQVFFCDVDAAAGRALASALGGSTVFRKVDLTREREVVQWVKEVGQRWRQIRVLVNNAARDPRIALDRTSAKDWDVLFALNLRAYFLTCREAVPWMRRGSSIINLASIVFHHGPANMSSYVATKGGVLGFTRALARELGPRRIRVNTLSPGVHHSPHYIFHGAMSQIRELDLLWNAGEFTPAARRTSAKHILHLWQQSQSYFGAKPYLQMLAAVAFRNDSAPTRTDESDLPKVQ